MAGDSNVSLNCGQALQSLASLTSLSFVVLLHFLFEKYKLLFSLNKRSNKVRTVGFNFNVQTSFKCWIQFQELTLISDAVA